MKLIKRNLLIAITMFSFSICTAQSEKPKKTTEQKSIEMTEKLNKEVKLTDAQQIKVKGINDVYLEKKKTIDFKILALEKEKKKLKEDRKTKINLILTEEQKKKQENLKKKKKSKKK